MKKLDNRKLIFVLLGITVVLVGILILSVPSNGPLHETVYNAIASPVAAVQDAFTKLGAGIRGRIEMVVKYDEINARIKELEEANAKMVDAVVENEELRRENRQLRGGIAYQDSYPDFRVIGGHVISGDVNELYNVYTISCGSSDGVAVGSFVVTSAGLVGVIQSVGPISSKVISIVDEQNKLIVRSDKHNELFRVSGAYSDTGGSYLKVDRIPKGAVLEVGDVLITTDSGKDYPLGVKVGTVSGIILDQNGEISYAIAKPFTELRTLDQVFVLTREKTITSSGAASNG